MAARVEPPGDKTLKPGPGAHSPEKVQEETRGVKWGLREGPASCRGGWGPGTCRILCISSSGLETNLLVIVNLSFNFIPTAGPLSPDTVTTVTQDSTAFTLTTSSYPFFSQVIMTKPCAPIVTFGIKHSDYMTPLVVDVE